MKITAAERMQALADSLIYLPPDTRTEDVVEFAVAAYGPDDDGINWASDPIDSRVYLVARNTRWLVELDDQGRLTVSPHEPDSP